MKNVFIIGAIDRFNYGDLLFPIILENEILSNHSDPDNVNIQFFGLVDSFMENNGGKNTKSIDKFYNGLETEKDVTVIVAGGEVLTPSWEILLTYLNKPFRILYDFLMRFYRYFKFRPISVFLNIMARKIVKGKTKYPFVIESKRFASDFKIIYNAVGGHNLVDIKNVETAERIDKYNYFAVRDKKTFAFFESKKVENVKLVPDCAVLLSDHYPLDALKTKISSSLIDKLEKYKDGYVVFQVAYFKYLKNKEEILRLVASLSEKYGFSILLCPIGTALGHEDHKAAKEIDEISKAQTYVLNSENVWDIMYSIASSKLFIGTSLHGTITSMSYQVPYICVDKQQYKLQAYINSWSPEPFRNTIDFSEVIDQIDVVFNIEGNILGDNINYQKKISKESLRTITSLI